MSPEPAAMSKMRICFLDCNSFEMMSFRKAGKFFQREALTIFFHRTEQNHHTASLWFFIFLFFEMEKNSSQMLVLLVPALPLPFKLIN